MARTTKRGIGPEPAVPSAAIPRRAVPLLDLSALPPPVEVIDGQDANAATERFRATTAASVVFLRIAPDHLAWLAAEHAGWRVVEAPAGASGALTRAGAPDLPEAA